MNEMINDRDMMYGGYFGGTPCNNGYVNFGYQGYPGSLMNTNMFPNLMGGYQNPNYIEQNNANNNYAIDLNTRLNNLETRVRILEQKLGNTDSFKDDNSMYMI